MENLTSKGKHTENIGNDSHINMLSKPEMVRRGEHKCRILEKDLVLRD